MNKNDCIKLYKEKLSALPPKWGEKLACVLCDNQQEVDCTDCEVLTELSVFSINEGNVCITYKDENGVSVKRCFDFLQQANQALDETDGTCLNIGWSSLPPKEKWQEIISSVCDCCEAPEFLYYTALLFICSPSEEGDSCFPQSVDYTTVHSPSGSPLSLGLYYPADDIAHPDEIYLIVGAASEDPSSILVDESFGTTDCDTLCLA